MTTANQRAAAKQQIDDAIKQARRELAEERRAAAMLPFRAYMHHVCKASSIAEIAREIDIARYHVSRVMSGKAAAGPKMIEAVRARYGDNAAALLIFEDNDLHE